MCSVHIFFFFFSSRRRHTRFDCDWSSDVCSSDLYIEFFNRLLPESRDAFYLREKYEREFANNPSYVEMYRRGNAYHGAHTFFMWYWGENGRQHIGKVIAAGAENAHVPAMLGWERADNLTEAIAMARSYMGNSAEITMLHQPMIGIADME